MCTFTEHLCRNWMNVTGKRGREREVSYGLSCYASYFTLSLTLRSIRCHFLPVWLKTILCTPMCNDGTIGGVDRVQTVPVTKVVLRYTLEL